MVSKSFLVLLKDAWQASYTMNLGLYSIFIKFDFSINPVKHNILEKIKCSVLICNVFYGDKGMAHKKSVNTTQKSGNTTQKKI